MEEYNTVRDEEVASESALTENENYQTNIEQTENIEFKRPQLECTICRKEFKTKNILKNHDEKFYIIRGQCKKSFFHL